MLIYIQHYIQVVYIRIVANWTDSVKAVGKGDVGGVPPPPRLLTTLLGLSCDSSFWTRLVHQIVAVAFQASQNLQNTRIKRGET
jgi:hypothetical protein